MPDDSVDLIFTDPPWSDPDLYSDLARFAARVLKPGRLCCVYASAAALPEVIARMGKHLDYYWCLAVGYQNARCHRNAMINFTGRGRRCWLSAKERSRSGARTPRSTSSRQLRAPDKASLHDWQQEGEPARYWIEKLTCRAT